MCDSCQIFMINGVLTHEIGCPEAWKDYAKECKNCGCDFVPEDKWQEFCDEECCEAYFG